MLEYRIMKGRNLKEDNMIKNSHCKPEKITCHAERQIDLRVSEFHNTETLKRVQGDMLQSPRSLWERVRVRGQNRGTVNSRVDFSLPETNGLPRSLRSLAMTKAFTLAEVLITLGIIGVVAAMTLPAVIQNHRKHIVETRLKKFYTTINQAIMLSEVDHGDKRDWDIMDVDTLYNEYIKKYIKNIKSVDYMWEDRNLEYVYFTDGSAVSLDMYNIDNTIGIQFIFYPEAKYIGAKNNTPGKTYFLFAFWPNAKTSGFTFHYNKGVEPYKAWWNGDPATLSSSIFGCNNSGGNKFYCTALIQYNGWKIPKDYPFRF
ncbi:type II secretion system protein [bacterium]|nr:type II secretion system protein [bacterium]